MSGYLEGFQGQTDARCLNPGATDFNTYVSICRTSDDNARANTFFSEADATYKASFQQLRAQYDDLIVMGDASNTLSSLAGATTDQVKSELNALSKKKDLLTAEISNYRRISESADKTFLEDIMQGTAKEQLTPTLQDVSLFLFWIGWLFIFITLVTVRWGSPGGGWRSGVTTLVLMTLVTIVLYALLKQVA